MSIGLAKLATKGKRLEPWFEKQFQHKYIAQSCIVIWKSSSKDLKHNIIFQIYDTTTIQMSIPKIITTMLINQTFWVHAMRFLDKGFLKVVASFLCVVKSKEKRCAYLVCFEWYSLEIALDKIEPSFTCSHPCKHACCAQQYI